MSGSIEALTAALNANTAAINKMIEISGGKPAAAASGKPATAGKPAATKPKGKTVEDMAAAFGGYLGVKDAEVRATRKAEVKTIVDYFQAPKATEIAEEHREEALKMLQTYIDGGVPDEFAGEGGGDDEALV